MFCSGLGISFAGTIAHLGRGGEAVFPLPLPFPLALAEAQSLQFWTMVSALWLPIL